MAVKASASITLSFMVDIKATYRYYKLQASTASAPSKPTAYPPSGWTTTEPSYTTGSTNTLYFVDCTVFTNGTFNYSAVSKSSSYEAAKEAFNKAQNAQNAANEAAKTATNYIYYDTTNGLQIGDKSSGKWEGTRAQIKVDSYNILNQNGVELASFGANEVRLGNESKDATISMRNGSLNISNVNKGTFDYTQIGCKGNFDVSSNNYTSDTQYKKGGMLTTVETKNLIEWRNLPGTTWRALSSYTWDDLNGPAFVAQRGTYFETRLYSEESDGSTENVINGSRISLMSSKEKSTNKITSEMELSSDKITFNGQVVLSYMMPVGYIFQWVPTNGGPDLSTADKVKAYYGFGTWEEISGRFLLGRSDSYGVGSTGGNETHTHTNPATGSTAITVDQMPSHVHELFANATFTVGNAGGTGVSGIPSNTSSWGNYTNAHWYTIGMRYTGGSQGHTHTMGSTGSTNSMPPYLSVYIWKRIA